MSQLLVLSIGVLVFSGIYMLLSFKFWRVIIGTVFLSHAVNLVLLSTGGYITEANAPILQSSGGELYMDPLPQALILTAIVISFGTTAFILIVLRQLYMETGTTDLEEVEREEWDGHGETHE